MAAFIDITRPLSPDLAMWPGDTPFRLNRILRLEVGDSVNLGSIQCSLHAGTHLDAPFHYQAGGTTIDQVEFSAVCGRAIVIDGRGRKALDTTLLTGLDLKRCPRVLVRTDAWRDPKTFPLAFPHPTAEFVELLGKVGVVLLGLDLPSVDAVDSTELPNHHALGRNGIHILESLDLSAVEAGEYELWALPLKLVGGDASPVRAVLRPL
jgi:arylformamidase